MHFEEVNNLGLVELQYEIKVIELGESKEQILDISVKHFLKAPEAKECIQNNKCLNDSNQYMAICRT